MSHERLWKAGDHIPSWGCRPISAREAEDLNRRERCYIQLTDDSHCVLLPEHEEDHENEHGVSLERKPTPGERILTIQERMWLRHLLQMISEQSRTVRDSIAPGNGLRITAEIWADQWAALTKEMDEYTKKLSSGKGPVAVTKYLDHNE